MTNTKRAVGHDFAFDLENDEMLDVVDLFDVNGKAVYIGTGKDRAGRRWRVWIGDGKLATAVFNFPSEASARKYVDRM